VNVVGAKPRAQSRWYIQLQLELREFQNKSKLSNNRNDEPVREGGLAYNYVILRSLHPRLIFSRAA
jgi:hypothetical protein